MPTRPLHSWDLPPEQAHALQTELADRLVLNSPLNAWKTVGAADVSYDRGDDRLFAAVVVLSAETFEVVDQAGVIQKSNYPYVPGLLSFREAPAVIAAFERLPTKPDVLLCDGQGIAHPRRLGIASHVGLWLDWPTVGCAKKKLYGHYQEPGPERGDRSPLFDPNGEVIGTVLRARPQVKPVFVSPGHHCDLESAVKLVMASTTKYRLPVPIRMAHNLVNAMRRAGDDRPA